MERAAVFVGATGGGWVGWWLGAFVGPGTAFTLSVVFTAVGTFGARRIARHYTP